jgi:hypothetical protein
VDREGEGSRNSGGVGTPGSEPANNLVGAPAKDNVFAGRAGLQFLDPGLGGLQIPDDFNPSETHGVRLFQNIEERLHDDTSLQ